MRLIECLHTQSSCYMDNEPAKQYGIVVHSTGANNPGLKRYVQPSSDNPKREELFNLIGENKNGNHWNRNIEKAVHYMIGELADGSVATVQTLPEDICCWGCGKGKNGSFNYNPTAHIQFEILEDDLKDKTYFEKVYKEATELCADICKRHGWDSSVIVSHKEAHKKKYASNHADIDHWLKEHKLTMNDFRASVQKILEKENEEHLPEFEPYKIVMGENPFTIYNDSNEKIGTMNERANITVIAENNEKLKIEAWIKKN